MNRISKLANLLALEPENRSIIRELNKEIDRRGILYSRREDVKAEILNEYCIVNVQDIVGNELILSGLRKVKPQTFFYFMPLSEDKIKLKNLRSELHTLSCEVTKTPLNAGTKWISDHFRARTTLTPDIYMITGNITNVGETLNSFKEFIYFLKFFTITEGYKLITNLTVKEGSRVVVPAGKEAVYNVHVLESKDENKPILIKIQWNHFNIDSTSTLFHIYSDEES